jgi:hypothetical protein
MYAPGVISSERLREWLAPHIEGKKQKDLALEWGVKQPTISRFKRQMTYDVPLDTVAAIASAMGFRDLSDFFRHVEQDLSPTVQIQTHSNAIGDTTPISPLHDIGRSDAAESDPEVSASVRHHLLAVARSVLALSKHFPHPRATSRARSVAHAKPAGKAAGPKQALRADGGRRTKQRH